MGADRKVKLVLGIPQDKKEVELELPDDEPRPWDLNSKLKSVGKKHSRLDALMKVTGRAKYTHDLKPEGMLFGGFIRSPHAKAEIKSFNLDPVKKAPGVAAVITVSNSKRVRYAGQPLVAVAAETRQDLEEALSRAVVEYDVLPHAARIEQAMADDAPQVHGNRPNISREGRRPNRDAVEKALSEAEVTVEGTCKTQVQTHSSLETHGTLAQWDGDHLHIWTSTQATFGVRQQVARPLELEESQVTVHCEFMGGGFGSKFMAGYWTLAAARLARETGRPVKMMLDRFEEQLDTGNRPDSIQKMKLGLSKDGKLGPYQVEIVGTPGIGRRAGARNPLIYEFPLLEGGDEGGGGRRRRRRPRRLVDKSEREVATNAGAQQAFRAPGYPQGAFGMETIMNLAAAKLGMDPLEFRRKNDPNKMRQVQYEDGAKLIGWSERKADGSATGRFRRGLGVGASFWPNFGGPRCEILCRLRPDGSVEVRSGAQDIGTGTRTIMALVVAEELGIPLERVSTAIGDTTDPIGPGSGGSRTASSLAPAARQSAFLAGQELRELVAKEMGCGADDLVLADGKVAHVKDAGKSVSFTDACRLIRDGEISAMGKRKRNWREATYSNVCAGVQFADIEVDVDYGTIKVNKVVALQDAGIIINRLTAESQVNGGVIQGISYALFEERHIDRQLGRVVNPDLEMYKILGPKDMPEVEVVLYDVANGSNNTSTVGIGEPTMVPTPAAISGAVTNALGITLKSLPLTPDKVLAALEAKEKGR